MKDKGKTGFAAHERPENGAPRDERRTTSPKPGKGKGKVAWSEGKLVGPAWARGAHAGGRMGAAMLFALTGLAGCADIPDFKKMTPYQPDEVRSPAAQPLLVLHTISFTEGSTVLTDTARDDLDTFLVQRRIDRTDSLTIVLPNDGTTSRARGDRIAAYLAYKHLAPSIAVSPRQAGTNVRLAVQRYQVTLPGCPDWTDPTGFNHTNRVHSNWGCATATNLGLMVANPRDLAEGADPGYGDGTAQVLGIQRYREGKTKPLQGAQTSDAPASGTGAPQAGNNGSGGGGQ